MKDFTGKIAVVTGGGSGTGRPLVRQFVADACNVAMCDFVRASDARNAAPALVESSRSDR